MGERGTHIVRRHTFRQNSHKHKTKQDKSQVWQYTSVAWVLRWCQGYGDRWIPGAQSIESVNWWAPRSLRDLPLKCKSKDDGGKLSDLWPPCAHIQAYTPLHTWTHTKMCTCIHHTYTKGRRRKEGGAEAHVLEKSQVISDLITVVCITLQW